MVKGVNKTVIEISCTDNGYFERAILFVNPEQSHISQKRLHSEAEKYVELLNVGLTDKAPQKPPEAKKADRHRYKIKTFLTAAALLAAAGVLFLIFNIL